MNWPPVDIIEMLEYIEEIQYGGINLETNEPYTDHEVAEMQVAQFWDNIYDEEKQKKLIVANSEFLRSMTIDPITLGHHMSIPRKVSGISLSVLKCARSKTRELSKMERSRRKYRANEGRRNPRKINSSQIGATKDTTAT